MNYLVLDTETTIKNNGSPFTKSNKLVCVGIKSQSETPEIIRIEYDDSPYGDAVSYLRKRIEGASFLVGFNIKFDLHWLRRYVPSIQFPRIFDCQLASFLLGNQGERYPSLDTVSERYALGRKLDIVASEYWANGIDTTEVPWEILSEYCERDVELTERIFHLQRKELSGNKRRLFALQCEDLLILEEMEWNGLKYNLKEAEKRSEEVTKEVAAIDEELRDLAGHNCINFGSDDHLSCLLYGGTVYERFRETYFRVLKDGTQKEKERWSERPIEFPRLVKPLPRTETVASAALSDDALASRNSERSAKGLRPTQRIYSVAEPVLRKLRTKGRAQRIVAHILKRAELQKLDSTYYRGLLDKFSECEWDDDTIHGQFNQVVAATGRLSSSNPNLQNFAGMIKDLFYSRYDC